MLSFINFLAFIVFAIGIGLYLFRTKMLLIYPSMKQPKSHWYEMALAGCGLILFVITMAIKGYFDS